MKQKNKNFDHVEVPKKNKKFHKAVDTMIDSMNTVVEELTPKPKPKKVPKKKKAKIIEDSITVQEHREILNEMKRKELGIRPGAIGRKSELYHMYESGEDKVVARKIFILASKGYSRKEIRTKLGIKLPKWRRMMNSEDHPIYKKMLTEGEDYAVEEIEEAIKKSAIGYDVEEREETIDAITGQVIRTKTTTKHFKPDVKAGMFILTNKRPNEYKLRRNDDQNVNVNIKNETIDYTKLDSVTIDKLLGAVNEEEMAKIIGNIPPVEVITKDE